MFRRLLIFAFIVAGFLLSTIHGQQQGPYIAGFKVSSNKTIRNSVDDNVPKLSIQTDFVYMVEVAAHLYVGSAQVAIRVHPPPEEQAYVSFFCVVVLDMNFDYFSALTMAEKEEVYWQGHKIQAQGSNPFIHPEFGFLTLANNIAYRSVHVSPSFLFL